MNTTSRDSATLERRQSIRIEPHRPDQQLRDMLHDVIKDPTARTGQRTPALTGWRWHDLTRDDPRCDVPFGDERTMIHDAIRNGCTTRERVLRYHLARLQDDMAQFPDASVTPTSDVLFVLAMAEMAESMEAVAREHTMDTPENRRAAVKEASEVIPGAAARVRDVRARGRAPGPGAR
jgi:hypothetical protein